MKKVKPYRMKDTGTWVVGVVLPVRWSGKASEEGMFAVTQDCCEGRVRAGERTCQAEGAAKMEPCGGKSLAC